VARGASQRRALRARAHGLGVRLQVGGNGLSPALLREADAVLERDELVKVRLPVGRDERDRLLAALALQCGAEVVSAIGRTGVLFRPAGQAMPAAGPLHAEDDGASPDEATGPGLQPFHAPRQGLQVPDEDFPDLPDDPDDDDLR